LKLFSFKGGVHPPDNKRKTENEKIEIMPVAKLLYISLLQHIGSPLASLVQVGDEVKKGQIIGESEAFLSVPVHSPVSGKVVKIEIHPYAVNGKIKTIVIENNEKEDWIEVKKYPNYKNMSKDKLIDIIKKKGVVGQGGAAFPTWVKLNPPNDVKIDTLILNGAECEPYLNSDNRLMIESPKKIVEGINIILKVLGIEKAIIGIENNKKEAYNKLSEAVKDEKNISISLLKTKYPQGGEKQLIKAILNRDVPRKSLPSKVGVVVQNTGTAKAIYDAVVEGKPLIERVVTVSGAGIENPGNYLVRIGTRFKDVLEYAHINREETKKIIAGGPMMGIAQFTEEVPTIKGTSGILAFTNKEISHYEPRNCISCGKCISACPMGLVPLMFAKLGRFNKWEAEAIKIGKSKLRAMKRK